MDERRQILGIGRQLVIAGQIRAELVYHERRHVRPTSFCFDQRGGYAVQQLVTQPADLVVAIVRYADEANLPGSAPPFCYAKPLG